MSGNEKMDLLRRWVVGGIFGAVAAMSLVWCVLSLAQGEMNDAFVMLGTCLFSAVVLGTFLMQRPIVDMDEDGVHVQVLFKNRFYPWKSFKQVGILLRMEKGKYQGRIVLVKENGTPRQDDQPFFLLRNYGRVIQLPAYTWLVREYVEKHYGPLDFNDAER